MTECRGLTFRLLISCAAHYLSSPCLSFLLCEIEWEGNYEMASLIESDWQSNCFINVTVALHWANEWIGEWMNKSGTSQLSQDIERGWASKYVTFTGMQEIEIRQTTVRQASCWGWEILSHVPHSTFPTEQCMLGNGPLITIKANMWWMHIEC